MTEEATVGDTNRAVLSVSMRPSQKELVDAAARAAGVSTSRWAREKLHAAAREEFRALLRGGEPHDPPAPEPTPERLREAVEAL